MPRIFLILPILLLAAAPARAQDADVPAAQLREAGTYHKLFVFEFRPGKTDDALEVLQATLVPAWRAAGVRVQVMEMLDGTRDVQLLIELRGGPATLAYAVPEQDAAAWAALVRIAGGAEEANEAVDRFIGHVARQSESLVFIRADPSPRPEPRP
jgi:hypothetical protein